MDMGQRQELWDLLTALEAAPGTETVCQQLHPVHTSGFLKMTLMP